MNDSIRNLLEMCEEYNATILEISVIHGYAIVERDDGTPTRMELNYETDTWS